MIFPPQTKIGSKNFTITVVDGQLVQANNSVIITQTPDTTSPLLNNPEDFIYENGLIPGPVITWIITGRSGETGTYTVKSGIHQIAEGNWYVQPGQVNATVVFSESNAFDGSNETFEITVVDSSGNPPAINSVSVSAVDTTPPQLNASDIIYEINFPIELIVWTLTGRSGEGGNYTIMNNTGLHETDFWSILPGGDRTFIKIFIPIFEHPATFTYTLTAYDSNANVNQHTVQVFVDDRTAPTILTPNDESYEISSLQEIETWRIVWKIIGRPGEQGIYVIDTGKSNVTGHWLIDSGQTNITISYEVTNKVETKIYNYTFSVFDAHRNVADSTVRIFIIDTIAPILNSPADTTYEFTSQATADWLPSWFITGRSRENGTYIISNNETVTTSGTWSIPENSVTTSIEFPLPADFGIGMHNLKLAVSDMNGNLVSDTVAIAIQDTVAPIVTISGNVEYEFSESKSFITWNIVWIISGRTEESGTYILEIDGEPETLSEAWSIAAGKVSTQVTLTLTSEVKTKTYQFALIATDKNGNYGSKSIEVTLQDTVSPIIQVASTLIYTMGSPKNTITWTINGRGGESGMYMVGLNQNSFAVDSWSINRNKTDTTVTLTLPDELELGTHELVIHIVDADGNQAQRSVQIIVVQKPTSNIQPSINTTSEMNFTTSSNSTSFPVIQIIIIVAGVTILVFGIIFWILRKKYNKTS